MTIVEAIKRRMTLSPAGFAAIDVYADLLAMKKGVRYTQVADTLRDMYSLGHMEELGFTRTLVRKCLKGGCVQKDSDAMVFEYHRQIPIDTMVNT